jgi:hypothetical protein
LLHHGKLDGFDPLIIRLIEAYRTLGRHQQAQDALSEMVTIPEAVPYNPHYLFVSPSTQITPAQIERAAKEQARARAIRSADPFASEAPQATPKATGPGDANF